MYDLEDSQPAKTFCQQQPLNLDQDKSGKWTKMTSYRGMISSFCFSTANRQYILFSVCQCARFQVNPRESILIAINKIFRYLKGLPNPSIWYPKDTCLKMFSYIDTDYAGCKKDRRIISRSCQLRGRRLISRSYGKGNNFISNNLWNTLWQSALI